jgi:hypothetical protein
MKSIMRGLSLISFAAALTVGASQGAEAQAYLRRFMPICEHIVLTVSPGAPPAAVCACTARRGFASIAANPATAAAVLQGLQTYNQFAFTGVTWVSPEQQYAVSSAISTLSAAFASCVAQPY